MSYFSLCVEVRLLIYRVELKGLYALRHKVGELRLLIYRMESKEARFVSMRIGFGRQSMKNFLFPTERAYRRHFTALAIALFFGGLLFLFESRADEILFSSFGFLLGWTLFSIRTGFILAIVFYLIVWLGLK